jgi:acyl carrier protein
MNIRSNPQVHNNATIESQLRTKWAELLGIDAGEISMQSDFFNLGGNSMLLLSLHIFVAQEFDLSVLIPDLIQNAVFVHMIELIQNGIAMEV